MIRKELDWIEGVWNTENYQSYKKENFQLLDDYINFIPVKILDIGCGLAWESRMFHEKYNCQLWLLDGDDKDNSKKPDYSSDGSWHHSAEDFLYYYSLEKLQSELEKLETKNYRLIDCNNITIPENIQFDLITSWVSCGFHYPVNTYRELILKHSHKDTVITMDIRKKRGNLILDENIQIIKILNERAKYSTAVIKIA